jgi:hypothetical protein
MPSIINASSTGSGGIVQTADASGVLQLQCNGTAAININSINQVSIATTNTGGALTTTTTTGNWGVLIYDQANNASMLQFRNVSGTAAGNISLSSAGATSILLSSVAGVNFPATQVASANANTLDDYEEGSWTPAVSFAGSAATLDSVQATYRKIGGFVFCAWNFRITNKGSGSGAIEIAGFPFSMTGGTSYGFGNAQGDSLALPSGAGSIMPYLSGTATRLLYQTNTAHSDTNNTQVNTNCSMYGFVVYTAA